MINMDITVINSEEKLFLSYGKWKKRLAKRNGIMIRVIFWLSGTQKKFYYFFSCFSERSSHLKHYWNKNMWTQTSNDSEKDTSASSLRQVKYSSLSPAFSLFFYKILRSKQPEDLYICIHTYVYSISLHIDMKAKLQTKFTINIGFLLYQQIYAII